MKLLSRALMWPYPSGRPAFVPAGHVGLTLCLDIVLSDIPTRHTTVSELASWQPQAVS